MGLRSRLGLWAYTPPENPAFPLVVRDLGELAEALEITTVAPGGFGDLACVVKLADARLPRPELGLFSRVCAQDGPVTVFSGEWADPALVLDGSGEYLLLSALGGGVALRDDPDESAYTDATAQSILAAEFAKRASYLLVDADQTLVLPDAPAAVFSPVFDGAHLEEIVTALCADLGDYTWGVWDHATHRDGAGFPTWQLAVHARDTTTTHYLAYAQDIVSWRVAPSAQRAFNVIQVGYVDVTTGPATVTVADTRLGGDGSQQQAPFRRRKLRVTLGHAPLSAAQATTIAEAWLAGYQNITNKVEVELRSVRDQNGVALPPHQVRADRNLYVPELAVRAITTLPSGPEPGTNQFYIVETSYQETASGQMRLVVQLDNYADRAAALLAQLKIAYDAARRRRGVLGTVISVGVPVVGSAGASFSNVAAGGTVAVVVSFPGTLAKAPTSVTLVPTGTTNASGASATNLSKTGFTLQWTAPSAGATSWIGTYQTVGN